MAYLEDETQVVQQQHPKADALLRAHAGSVKTVIFDDTLRVDQSSRVNPQASLVLLLKICDSQTDLVARAWAHTAFYDPTPPKAPQRRNIGLRALVVFDD